jgi:hypothetical protein
MNVYRWAASGGLFFGGISAALTFEQLLPFHVLDVRLACPVILAASLAGVGTSLLALFLHPEEAFPTLLGHRAVAFVGIGLSSWPWMLMVWILWFLEIGPP